MHSSAPDDHVPAPPGPPPGAPHVDLRRRSPNLVGWWVAVVLLVYLALGMTVFTGYTVVVVMGAPDLGGVGTVALFVVLTVVLGLLSRAVIRMAPRYYTTQGVAVTDDGILLYQDPRRRFPGRRLHIPWQQVRRISLEHRRGSENSRAQYNVVLDLATRVDPADSPTWALVEPDRVTLWGKRSTQPEIAELLRAARPELFA